MRAASIVHVEFEVLNAILDSDIIAEVVAELREQMVPENDSVAERRFVDGTKKAAQLIQNLADRRTHRLPEDHPDFEAKEE
jgi:hypothetical protein